MSKKAVVADKSTGDVHASEYDAVVAPGDPDTLRQDARVCVMSASQHTQNPCSSVSRPDSGRATCPATAAERKNLWYK